jgi:hypothetical protein
MTDVNLILAEYYAKSIISQYHTEKNINFLTDLFTYCIKYSPLRLEYYWDFLNTRGEHLTKIAFTLFQIKRNFENITLNDDEIKIICQFKIIKDNIRILSYINIENITHQTFQNNISVVCEPELIIYYIKESFLNNNIGEAIIFYKLLPVPINANGYMYKLQEDRKYIHFPDCRNIVYNDNQARPNDMQNFIDGDYSLMLGVEGIVSYI